MPLDQNDPAVQQYMDQFAMQFGAPPSSVGGRAPAGAVSYNPYLADMNPSLPQTNSISRLMPNRPRLGNALDNASLAMSMIPTGETIGENIQNVSGAMQNMPFARLAHQYQMLQPAQGYKTEESKIADVMSQVGMRNMQATWYGGRNQADIQAQTNRGLAAAQARERNSTRGSEFQEAPADDPYGHFKKGEIVEGKVQETEDPNNPGQYVEQFQPSGRTQADVAMYGGMSNTGAVGRGTASYNASMSPNTRLMNFLTSPVEQGGMGLNPDEANTRMVDKRNAPLLAMFGVKQSAGPSASDLANKAIDEKKSAGASFYQDKRRDLTAKLKPSDYRAAAQAQGIDTSKDDFDVMAFGQQYEQQRKQQLDALDNSYGDWSGGDLSKAQPFEQAYQQGLKGAAPSPNAKVPTYNLATGKIE